MKDLIEANKNIRLINKITGKGRGENQEIWSKLGGNFKTVVKE